MRQTKIICTMGPSCDSDETVKDLMLSGMDAARFNFSHGSYEEHKVRMDRVKRIARELKMEIPLILDTKGPEIRVRNFENGFVILQEGQSFTLYASEDVIGNENGVSVTFPYLSEDVKKGDEILIDDGLVSMTVESISGNDIICRVKNGGKISNHKSINVPGVEIDQSYISEKDRKDILYCFLGHTAEIPDFYRVDIICSCCFLQRGKNILIKYSGYNCFSILYI